MVTLCAVGDLMLGDSEKCIGYGSRSLIEKFGFDYPFEAVRDNLKADIVFGNLESVMSDYRYDPLKMSLAQMRTSASTIEGVKRVFNVINVANNHTMQHGEHCFNETIENLLRNNIGVVGLKGRGHFSSQPYIKRISNLDIGFLGYAFEKDKYCEKPLYAQGIEQSIISDVKKLKLEVDVVIVSCHWGDEFIERPPLKVIKLSKKIIENGASLILGHHPHVIQPVERYSNGIIAYSLGNFVSDMAWDVRLLTGLVLKIGLEKTRANLNKAFLANNKLSQVAICRDITFDVENSFDIKTMNSEFYEKQYLAQLKRLIFLNRLKMYLYFFKNYRRIRKEIFFEIIRKRLLGF